ncbi:hypothetical protein [Tenacibaculum caenipelagi]|uniref:Uncharacterized protein n=1 Tax=Tenacibaculum caenipelagi TaxID=1325435 RepID=A0A4R6TIF3_9FLAO|nr:hypothetical protein [Tenacibaculum caenipelagi]TDQ27621.1 hypothetical protein DFQ07_1472 [Tenacibaculum caenipelagi]
MNTKQVIKEVHSKESTANETLYFPFANGEVTTGIIFSEPTGYVIKTVENNNEISSGSNSKTESLGMLETHCLIVETTKSVTVEVYTNKH